MRTHRAVTRISSEPVAMRPIVNRITHACENITFPSVSKNGVFRIVWTCSYRGSYQQIPFGFCANLSVFVSVSVSGSVRTPLPIIDSDTSTDTDFHPMPSDCPYRTLWVDYFLVPFKPLKLRVGVDVG